LKKGKLALSNVNGEIVERYSYDVFGEPTIQDADGNEISDSNYSNPYMFTGRRFDPEAGLYYYRARYYNPTIGRFLQPDPIYYAAGLNLYTYCGNDPINWVDPGGQNPLTDLYHLALSGVYTVEAGLSAALELALKPLSKVGYLGNEVIIPETPFNPQIHIPTELIATTASMIDQVAGDWLDVHTDVSINQAMQNLLESGFAPGNIKYEWEIGEDGVLRPVAEWIKGDDGVWRPVPLDERPTPKDDEKPEPNKKEAT